MSIDQVMTRAEPVLLLLTHGSGGAHSDVNKALQAAEKAGLTVMRVDVDAETDYAEKFQVGKHPVLLALHNGEVIARRSRPWGPDADAIIERARALFQPTNVIAQAEEAVATKQDEPLDVTDQTFMRDVIESELPVVVDFWAEWCGPCRMVAPILEKLAKEYAGRVRVAKVDVDANPGLSQQFRIQSIPTMMFVKEGKIVGQTAGAAPEAALRDVFEQLIALQLPADAE
ncbi:MAG: thioredoxin [Anaerolineales bacterium]